MDMIFSLAFFALDVCWCYNLQAKLIFRLARQFLLWVAIDLASLAPTFHLGSDLLASSQAFSAGVIANADAALECEAMHRPLA